MGSFMLAFQGGLQHGRARGVGQDGGPKWKYRGSRMWWLLPRPFPSSQQPYALGTKTHEMRNVWRAGGSVASGHMAENDVGRGLGGLGSPWVQTREARARGWCQQTLRGMSAHLHHHLPELARGHLHCPRRVQALEEVHDLDLFLVYVALREAGEPRSEYWALSQ